MNRPMLLAPVALLAALAAALAGCFKPPEIVMVDRATALEQQASGSFDDLEQKLDRFAIEPRPVPLTEDQLQALGVRPAPLVDESDLTDADRLDGFLAQHPARGRGRMASSSTRATRARGPRTRRRSGRSSSA